MSKLIRHSSVVVFLVCLASTGCGSTSQEEDTSYVDIDASSGIVDVSNGVDSATDLSDDGQGVETTGDAVPHQDAQILDEEDQHEIDTQLEPDLLDVLPEADEVGSLDVEVDFDDGAGFYCPAEGDTKPGTLPDCPYEIVHTLFGSTFFKTLQFERWEPGVEPGLPESVTPAGDDVFALIRVRWHDPWTEGGAVFEGLQQFFDPDWADYLACGGHCFLAKNFVWVVDMKTLTLVGAWEEPDSLEVWSELVPTTDPPGGAPCYGLEFVEQSYRLEVCNFGDDQVTGTTPILKGAILIRDMASEAVIATIDLPLW